MKNSLIFIKFITGKQYLVTVDEKDIKEVMKKFESNINIDTMILFKGNLKFIYVNSSNANLNRLKLMVGEVVSIDVFEKIIACKEVLKASQCGFSSFLTGCVKVELELIDDTKSFIYVKGE